MKICFVAAPLIARSGVYNSARELVEEARSSGHDWHALLGVSAAAGGSPRRSDGVTEFTYEPRGVRSVIGLAQRLAASDAIRTADLVVSLVPQSDMALSLTPVTWVAYLRGLPWPAAGESSAMKAAVWRALERTALTRASEVWATTPLLARQVGSPVDRLVTPGIAHPQATHDGRGRAFVWAARYSADKDPMLFVEALRGAAVTGVMFGSGPLEGEIRRRLPENVTAPGWVEAERLWSDARVYVGTSSREAFGRSAVEAAMLGIPPLISADFGCAEMLYTSDPLRRVMVLESREPSTWRKAMETIDRDPALYEEASSHVRRNAARLTVAASVENVAAAGSTVTAPSRGPR